MPLQIFQEFVRLDVRLLKIVQGAAQAKSQRVLVRVEKRVAEHPFGEIADHLDRGALIALQIKAVLDRLAREAPGFP